MDTEQNEQPGWQREGESLNTGSSENAAGLQPIISKNSEDDRGGIGHEQHKHEETKDKKTDRPANEAGGL